MKDAAGPDWASVRLGDLCYFENGDRGKNYPGRRSVTETGVPFVNAGHLNNGRIDWDKMDHIPEEHFHRLGSGKIKKGDILFCLRGSLGKFGIVDRETEGAIASSLVIVRAGPRVVREYLGAYFESNVARDMIQIYAGGAAQPNLSAASLKSFILPLPPLEEQKRIVAVLDQAFAALDRARALAEANLADAEELFSRLAVTLFERISGHGTPVASVAEVAQARKGSVRTGPFGSQLKHGEFVGEGICVLGIDNAVKNEFQWGKSRHITPEKYASLSRYRVHPGDVIITIMGTCGRCAIIPDDIPLAINTKHLCCITLDKSKCLPEYLHRYFLLSPKALDYLSLQTKGTVMDGLNMGIIRDLPVDLPALDKQKSICDQIDDVEQRTQLLSDAYNGALADIATLRQSLLHRAFSGKLT